MKLPDCHFLAESCKIIYKTFHAVQLGGVNPGAGKTQRMRNRILSIKTAVIDGKKTDIGIACDAKLLCQCVHGTSDPPGSGSAGQKDQSDSPDQRRFFGKTRLDGRYIFSMGC